MPQGAVTRRLWAKFLLAILLGNALYLILSPHLPLSARRQARFSPDLGTLVDFWFCLFVYGLIELVAYLRRRHKPKP